MSKALSGLMAAVLLAACSGGSPSSSSPGTQLHLTGTFDVQLTAGKTEKCSLSEFGDTAALVFNGAVSGPRQPGYALLFSLFPYHGPASYALSSQTGGSQVQVIVGRTGEQYRATGGSIEVQTSTAKRASGKMQVHLVGADPTHAIDASGRWTCPVGPPLTATPSS